MRLTDLDHISISAGTTERFHAHFRWMIEWMSGDRDQWALALTTALTCNSFSIDKKTRDQVYRFNRKCLASSSFPVIISSIFLLPNFCWKSHHFHLRRPNQIINNFSPPVFFLQIKAHHVTDDTTEVFSPRFHWRIISSVTWAKHNEKPTQSDWKRTWEPWKLLGNLPGII